jgi:hypothetical protein
MPAILRVRKTATQPLDFLSTAHLDINLFKLPLRNSLKGLWQLCNASLLRFCRALIRFSGALPLGT